MNSSALAPLLYRLYPMGCLHPTDPDAESLTSWLYRLARVNGYRTYAAMLRERKMFSWAFNDAPHKLTAQVQLLHRLSDIPETVLARTHLNHPLENMRGRYMARHMVNLWLIRFLNCGSAGNGNPHAVCAQCIKEASNEYWLKAWRLSFWTQCPTHHVLMLEQCQCCGLPICMHLRRSTDLSRCERCETPFRNEIILNGDPVWTAPPYLYEVFQHSAASLPINVTDMTQWWRGLRDLIDMTCTPKHAAALMVARKRIPDIYHPLLMKILGSYHLRFDRQPIEVRHQVLCFIGWLLQSWPSRFFTVFASADPLLSESTTADHLRPQWLLKAEKLRVRAKNSGRI